MLRLTPGERLYLETWLKANGASPNRGTDSLPDPDLVHRVRVVRSQLGQRSPPVLLTNCLVINDRSGMIEGRPNPPPDDPTDRRRNRPPPNPDPPPANPKCCGSARLSDRCPECQAQSLAQSQASPKRAMPPPPEAIQNVPEEEEDCDDDPDDPECDDDFPTHNRKGVPRMMTTNQWTDASREAAEATRRAGAASVSTGHDGAIQHSYRAEEEGTRDTGDHGLAAGYHEAAAEAHTQVAKNAARKGNMGTSSVHQAAAQSHTEAAEAHRRLAGADSVQNARDVYSMNTPSRPGYRLSPRRRAVARRAGILPPDEDIYGGASTSDLLPLPNLTEVLVNAWERSKAEGSNADAQGDGGQIMRAGRQGMEEAQEAGYYWEPKIMDKGADEAGDTEIAHRDFVNAERLGLAEKYAKSPLMGTEGVPAGDGRGLATLTEDEDEEAEGDSADDHRNPKSSPRELRQRRDRTKKSSVSNAADDLLIPPKIDWVELSMNHARGIE